MNKKRNRYSEEFKELVCEGYPSQSIRQLCLNYGVHQCTVRRWLSKAKKIKNGRYGFTIPDDKKLKPHGLTEYEKMQILKYLNLHVNNVAYISRATGISKWRIHHFIKPVKRKGVYNKEAQKRYQRRITLLYNECSNSAQNFQDV